MLERFFERMIFSSRWLLAPFFVGLIVAKAVLLIKFAKELKSLVLSVLYGDADDAVISILTLVDTALIASLLLIITLSGYENFVSKIDVGNHEDRPAWMGKVGFADLKLKLIGAIVAISAVELLKSFLQTGVYDNAQMAWKVGIHMTFVFSGVMFALTEYIADQRKDK